MESAPLIALLVMVLALLGWRAVTRERREYARFRRLRTTGARQKVYRRWLVESLAIMGGLSVVVAFGAWGWMGAAVADAQNVAWVAGLRSWLSSGLGLGLSIGLGLGFLGALVVPVLALRRTPLDEIPTVGDIRALLPRTRGELPYGAGLALSAGVFEETLFRLALPALLFGIVGDGLLAFTVCALIFGLLHLYQGPVGVLFAALLGLVLAALYVLSGSILLPIAVHAAIDLRSLVLLPVVLGRAWTETGTVVRRRPRHHAARDDRAAPAE